MVNLSVVGNCEFADRNNAKVNFHTSLFRLEGNSIANNWVSNQFETRCCSISEAYCALSLNSTYSFQVRIKQKIIKRKLAWRKKENKKQMSKESFKELKHRSSKRRKIENLDIWTRIKQKIKNQNTYAAVKLEREIEYLKRLTWRRKRSLLSKYHVLIH